MTDSNGAAPDEPRSPNEMPSAGGPIVNAPKVVVIIIAILIAIQGLIQYGGPNWEIWSIAVFALIPARFAGTVAMIEGSQWWSFVTYAFLHADWMHVLLNSVWFLIFGTPVARYFGTLRFLAIALVSTLGGALVMVLRYQGSPVPIVGASAAVSGLLAAAIPIIFGRPHAPLSFGDFLRERRAIIFTLVFLAMTLASGVQIMPTFADGVQIAWEAHLGGFAAGLIAYFFLSREGVHTA